MQNGVFNPYIYMKKFNLKQTAIFAFVLQFACRFLGGCGEICPSGYDLKLPKAPQSWVSILGQPHWRIEWIDSDGVQKVKYVPPDSSPEIEIPAEEMEDTKSKIKSSLPRVTRKEKPKQETTVLPDANDIAMSLNSVASLFSSMSAANALDN